MPDKRPERTGNPAEDDGIVRHYSREHRLSRASPEVRWLVKQYDGKRPGFLGSLVATRSLRFVFFSVLLFMAAGGLLSFLSGRQDSGILGDQLYKVSAFRFGESLYITLTRTAKTEAAFTGTARMTAFVDKKYTASMDFSVSARGQEEYRLTAANPDPSDKLSLLIEAGGLRLELTAPIR